MPTSRAICAASSASASSRATAIQQVIDWMVARYGNFVRLRPPFNAMTLVLWGAPGIALLAGIAAAVIARRRRPPDRRRSATRNDSAWPIC